MILSRPELELLKPVFALLEHFDQANLTFTISLVPGGRVVSIDVCSSGVTVKAVFPDSAPTVEHFKSPMGLAQSYGVSLAKITNRRVGD